MRSNYFHSAVLALGCAIVALSGGAQAEPQHGIAMYGAPALPPDFVSLPYANPDAPTGGRIVQGEVGSFDSLNPHIRKGRVPWQLRFLAYESLMGRSWDEPFTLYGVLAESIEVGDSGDWVEFTLNPAAEFSDGSPVAVDDVLWSFETLGTQGHSRYEGAWKKIAKASSPRAGVVRFEFNEENRELALIMGLRPILKKAQWDGKDFAESGLDVVPISSAPYVIEDFQAGRFVSLKRNPEYWGRDIAFRRGTNNLDEIRMEFFGDATAMFEAFKAGELNTMRETNAAKWQNQYDFQRMQSGAFIKSVIPHERPSGMTGFVMNTRNPIFADWQVREAMIQAFNFEFINDRLNAGALPRATSYFSNSKLGMQDGPAEGRVAEFLAAFEEDLLPGVMEGYSLPTSDGSERNRAGIREALRLFEEAGWTVQDGVMTDASGTPFVFEIVLQNGSAEIRAIMNIYTQALERLGIFPSVSSMDSAQFRERMTNYDFDMTYERWGLSLSPGNEQLSYWGAEGATNPGSRNLAGINDPAVEAMIRRMLTSDSQDDYVAAVRALDRILTAGRYVVPIWYSDKSFLAHDKRLKYSADLPAYGDWIGFQPDVWWWEQ